MYTDMYREIHQSVTTKQNPMSNKAHRLRFSTGSSGASFTSYAQSRALDSSLTRAVSRISRAGAGSFELWRSGSYQGWNYEVPGTSRSLRIFGNSFFFVSLILSPCLLAVHSHHRLEQRRHAILTRQPNTSTTTITHSHPSQPPPCPPNKSAPS